jgi:hypothetical protein
MNLSKEFKQNILCKLALKIGEEFFKVFLESNF